MMGWMNPNNLTRKNMSSYSPYCTIMAEEINQMLDVFVDDMRQALDYLLDVVKEDYAERASGFGQTHEEKIEKIRKATEIYYKHFA